MWREHIDGAPPSSRFDPRPWRLATQAEFDREVTKVERQSPGRYRPHAFPVSLLDSRNGNVYIYWKQDPL